MFFFLALPILKASNNAKKSYSFLSLKAALGALLLRGFIDKPLSVPLAYGQTYTSFSDCTISFLKTGADKANAESLNIVVLWRAASPPVIKTPA